MTDLLTILIWKQFWQITLLIPVVVLLVRHLLRKSPYLSYGLLLLVLVKTVFPPVWDAPTGFLWEMMPFSQWGKTTEMITVSPFAETPAVESTVPELPTPTFDVITDERPNVTGGQASPAHTLQQEFSSALSMTHFLLMGIWSAGGLVVLSFVYGKQVQLLRFHRDMQLPPNDDLLECMEIVSEELGLRRVPKVLVTRHPTVPFASGYFDQVVVLPVHLIEQTDRDEVRMVIAHEMTHLRRGDTLVGMLQLAAQGVWWFHPFVYWLNFEVRRLREECCDSEVVLRLKCPPAQYANCLINMLEWHRSLRPAVELVGLSPLEVTVQRMESIMRAPASSRRRVDVARDLTLLLLGALLVLPAEASWLTKSETLAEEKRPGITVEELNGSKEIVITSQEIDRTPESALQSAPPELPAESAESAVLSGELIPRGMSTVELPDYSWVPGDQHRYTVTLIAKHPLEERIHAARPTFQVAAVAAGIPAFSLQNAEFTKEVTPREGVEIPSLPQLEVDPFSVPDFPFPGDANGFLRPDFRTAGSTRSVVGTNVAGASPMGELPYLLGRLQDWVFPAISSAGGLWEEEFTREVVLLKGQPQSLSFISSPSQEHLHARIRIRSEVTKVAASDVQFSRSWKLLTRELVDGQPRREVALDGHVFIDTEGKIPVRSQYAGKLIERELNHEYRIPLTLEIKRFD